MLATKPIPRKGESLSDLEEEALGKANANKIMAPVEAGAIANGWELQPLRTLAQDMSDKEIVRHALVFHSSLVVPKFVHECMRNLYESLQWNGQDAFRDDVPMWAWRAIIEAEGVTREILPANVSITSASPFDDNPEPRPPRKRRPEVAVPAGMPMGRTSSDVKDPEERRKILEDYEDNKLSYIDLETKYGLRQTNGMNAYRIVKAMRAERHTTEKPKKKPKAGKASNG